MQHDYIVEVIQQFAQFIGQLVGLRDEKNSRRARRLASRAEAIEQVAPASHV